MTASLPLPALDPQIARRNQVDYRRIEAFGGLDVLHATYIDHAFSPHLHEVYALGVITHGANTLSCRGATQIVRTGQMVVIEPGEMHTGEPAGDDGWTYRMIYPAANVLEAATASARIRSRGAPHFASTVIDDPARSAAFVRLHRFLESSDCVLEQESRLLSFLRSLARAHAERGERVAPARDHRAVAVVREYLHAHFNRSVRLATLSSLTGLSPFHLIRVFRSSVGLPPYAYLEQIRVSRAQALLRAGIPVSRVAFATGFSDQSHLTRHFKRVLGLTPGQYLRGAVRR